MTNRIQHKRSSTSGAVPTPAQLEPGELAINLADQLMWTKTVGGSIVELVPPTVSQAEAAAGTATARRSWTAQRVRQAITGWWATVTDAIKSFNTNITGSVNRFVVSPATAAAAYSIFVFESHSGPVGSNFGTVGISANPEENIALYAYTNPGETYRSGTLAVNRDTVSLLCQVDSTAYEFLVTGTGYSVSHPANFRAAIGAGTSNFDGAFSSLTGRPTTLSGYGITDAQATLVSGTNIRTINGNSLLGSGDIVISGGSGSTPIAAGTILGNNTGASAVPVGLTPAQVRELISAISPFTTLITGQKNEFVLAEPANDGGYGMFSFTSHNGPAGDNFGEAAIVVNAEEGARLQVQNPNIASAGVFVTTVNGVRLQAQASPVFGATVPRTLQVFSNGYSVSHPSEFRNAINAPSRDEALYYAIALGGI